MLWLADAFEAIRDFMSLGGPVLRVIAVVTLFMWMLIIERLVYLRTGHRKLVRKAHNYWDERNDYSSWRAHQIRARIISQVSANAERNLSLIKTCVALCPLLGLLGTMIEVFEVMAISGSGNPRSMASGVSKATVPTMAGMVAALSGVAMSAYLENKARREREFIADELIIEHG